jgi:putative endonuclease
LCRGFNSLRHHIKNTNADPKSQHFLFYDLLRVHFTDQLNRTFYKGSTDNLVRRLNDHNQGSVTFSSKFRPWNLVWFTTKNTRAEAVALEIKLKNLSAIRLKEFMKKYPITDQPGFVIIDVINQV